MQESLLHIPRQTHVRWHYWIILKIQLTSFTDLRKMFSQVDLNSIWIFNSHLVWIFQMQYISNLIYEFLVLSKYFVQKICRCVQCLIDSQLKKIRSTLTEIRSLDNDAVSVKEKMATLKASQRKKATLVCYNILWTIFVNYFGTIFVNYFVNYFCDLFSYYFVNYALYWLLTLVHSLWNTIW